MNDLLVGSTGFVGGNLMRQHPFERVCHSSDVTSHFGSCPDICIYAGVPSAMFLANHDSAADLSVMRQARQNIRNINPRQLVLVSTIAVYDDSRGKTEEEVRLVSDLAPYGYNRLLLEQWVREDFPEAFIIRLPALYGYGLKKNFLYDLHTIIPAMLRPEKYDELSKVSHLVKHGYSLGKNGFYQLNGQANKAALRAFFDDSEFNALSFTDSRSRFQFYNLKRLWEDIEKARAFNLKVLNLASPPLSASCVYEAVTGKKGWINEVQRHPYEYDMRSSYAELMGGGADGYLFSEKDELNDICAFMAAWGAEQ